MKFDDGRPLHEPPRIRIAVADYAAALQASQLDALQQGIRATIDLEDTELVRFVRLLRQRHRPALRLIGGGKQ
jgi:hypothetical protein